AMIPMSIAMLGVTALVAGGVGLYLRGRRRRARALYMAHLESALADGILTEAEAAELESLRTASDLSEREVRMVGLALYRRALREVVADARVTPEEEANLRRLQMQLGLTEHDLASDRDQIRRMRLLAQIEDGRLPEVRAPLDLAADETCHWVVRATLCSPLALGRREPVGVVFRPDGAEPFHVVGERAALEPNPAILPLAPGHLPWREAPGGLAARAAGDAHAVPRRARPHDGRRTRSAVPPGGGCRADRGDPAAGRSTPADRAARRAAGPEPQRRAPRHGSCE